MTATMTATTMATATAENHSTIGQEKTLSLFKTIEQHFAKTSLGPERWYLLALAAIVGGGEPDTSSALYTYLISDEVRQTTSARQALVRRLRETLVKSIGIYGVCKPIEAIVSINSVEREEDKDHTCSRGKWSSGEENRRRGREWLQQVYTQNLDFTMGLFKDHLDFAYITEDITYGFYLADRQNLDDIDTEIVVLAGIMIQNLPKETWWHIRGCRRVGISQDDTQIIWDCVQLVARYLGLNLTRVPNPAEVESDV